MYFQILFFLKFFNANVFTKKQFNLLLSQLEFLCNTIGLNIKCHDIVKYRKAKLLYFPLIKTGFVRFLSRVKEDLQPGQQVVQGYVSIWRIFIFITGALVTNIYEGIDAKSFFSPKFTIPTPLYIFAIQAVCAMTMYQSCKSRQPNIHTYKNPILNVLFYIHKND